MKLRTFPIIFVLLFSSWLIAYADLDATKPTDSSAIGSWPKLLRETREAVNTKSGTAGFNRPATFTHVSSAAMASQAGTVGPQGIQGIQGQQGIQGNAGAKGDKGDKGDTGPAWSGFSGYTTGANMGRRSDSAVLAATSAGIAVFSPDDAYYGIGLPVSFYAGQTMIARLYNGHAAVVQCTSPMNLSSMSYSDHLKWVAMVEGTGQPPANFVPVGIGTYIAPQPLSKSTFDSYTTGANRRETVSHVAVNYASKSVFTAYTGKSVPDARLSSTVRNGASSGATAVQPPSVSASIMAWISGAWSDIGAVFQRVANLITSFPSSSTTNAPTAKAVSDALDIKKGTAAFTTYSANRQAAYLAQQTAMGIATFNPANAFIGVGLPVSFYAGQTFITQIPSSSAAVVVKCDVATTYTSGTFTSGEYTKWLNLLNGSGTMPANFTSVGIGTYVAPQYETSAHALATYTAVDRFTNFSSHHATAGGGGGTAYTATAPLNITGSVISLGSFTVFTDYSSQKNKLAAWDPTTGDLGTATSAQVTALIGATTYDAYGAAAARQANLGLTLLSGNTTKAATAAGTLTNGNCAQWDSNGNIVAASGPCTTGGSMTWPTTVGIPYWTSGTAWGGAYNGSTQIPASYVPFASPGAIGGTTPSAITGTTVTGTTLVSTVATGTAPLTVASTTKVSGLNVEQVDGHDAGSAAGNLPILDGSALIPLAEIPATLTGKAAATLITTRAIYGNNFDGSAALTQIIASTYGGTGNGFTKISGPTTSERTFTLPDASATILTDNALVTGLQGGTGVNNSGKTITLGGNLTTSGAFAVTLTATGATNVTLPVSGTLATTAGNVATATSLAANGLNCSAGNYPLGVDQWGAVESCSPLPTLSGLGGVAAISSGTAALGTSSIASATCDTVVTVAGTGIATTDVMDWGFNGDPTGVVGYQASTNGMLTIIAYPTAGNFNAKVCNNTGSSITPGAITLNWRVRR